MGALCINYDVYTIYSRSAKQLNNSISYSYTFMGLQPITNKPLFYIGNPTVLLSTVMFTIHLKASACWQCWGRGLRHVPIFYSVLLNTSCDCSAESTRIRSCMHLQFSFMQVIISLLTQLEHLTALSLELNPRDASDLGSSVSILPKRLFST